VADGSRPNLPTLLCVHPHPDDESIACGGVLARAASSGVRTVVVTCTGGEEGENLAGIDLGGRTLVEHRRDELAEALAILGVARHHRLGFRDSGMAGSAANDHPGAFHRADLDVAATRLAAIVRAERPQVVVSDDERGTYGHPDHVKAHAVTVRALELAADPDADVPGVPWRVVKRYVHSLGRRRLLAGHRALLAAGLASPFGDAEVTGEDDIPFGTPDADITTEVDIGPWLATKRRAMAAHRSQIGPESFFLNSPEDMTAPFLGLEQFVLEAGTLGTARPEPDLFAGLGALAAGLGAPPGADVAPVRGDRSLDVRDPAAFRAVLGRFATGVTVMTTVHEGVPHGMTANAVASVSLAPPLVLVCVGRHTVMAEFVRASGVFALSILRDDQAARSVAFADPVREVGSAEFVGVETSTATTGAPLLAGAIGHLDCRVHAIHDGGDHLIVVGEVQALAAHGTSPLVYFRGAYGRYVPAADVTGPAAILAPGHAVPSEEA
jgi:N-acetyl-1-D-myo-inositol-2-amino-2-deoxy-alpha-D-glucopyranoside deacetylase